MWNSLEGSENVCFDGAGILRAGRGDRAGRFLNSGRLVYRFHAPHFPGAAATRNPMVIVRIRGGLGNQLFMYAAGRALAAWHRVPLRLDLAAYRDGSESAAFGLRHFAIPIDEAGPEAVARLRERAAAGLGSFSLWAAIRARVAVALGMRRPSVFEAGGQFAGTYLPAILATPSEVYLDGYWQSEQYFSAMAGELRRDLRLTDPPSGPNLDTAREIESCESVSLHVRRGDYAGKAFLSDALGVLPAGYYRSAARIAAGGMARPRVFVFSDDPDWAEAHLGLDFPTTLVRHNGPEQAHEDLRLMSLCRRHVIANSTLSWWGAWLSHSPDQVVVAPRDWFQKVPMPDIVPARWLRA